MRRPSAKPQSKTTRQLITAIRAAGGTVTLTARGHLRVAGPGGVAFVTPEPLKHGRGRANMLGSLRKYAGIDVTTG